MGLIALWHVEPLGPGIKPVSPALAGGFLSTEPPGKSHVTPILLTLGKKEMADAKEIIIIMIFFKPRERSKRYFT